MKIGFSTVVLLLFFSCVSGQKNKIEIETVFSGNVQPRPLVLPAPKYPPAPILPGIISVEVSVDETGKVSSATNATGPYPVCKSVNDPIVLSFRTAAIEAARKSKFAPTMIDKKPIKIGGRINYTLGSPKVELRVVKNHKLDRLTRVVIKDSSTSVIPVDNREQRRLSGISSQAKSLGKPKYPAAARAVRATGVVQVQVLTDEKGNVYSAEAVSGHPLLRGAAENAACDSRFFPTHLSGKPVKVSMILTYNFVP